MKKNYLAVICIAFSLAMAGCSGGGEASATETTVAETGAAEAAAEETTAKEETTEAETAAAEEETAEAAAETGETVTEEATEAAENEAVLEAESTEEAAETQQTAENEAAVEVTHSGFVFVKDGATIGMNENVAPALEALGAYESYSETTSCAFKGLDKIYSYAGFDLYTYPVDDQDFVNSIYFADDSVATAEGIRIGSTVDEMLAAYGNDYVEEYGVYQYTKDRSILSFIVTDGVIEAIEYVAITE